MQQFYNKLVFNQAIRKIELLKDNKTSLILTKNLENQNCTKYIHVMHYHI